MCFCGEELREDTKVEHLIQRSMGGKISRANVTCTECNEFFANGDGERPQLDEELAAVFASTMNILKPALPADVGGASIEAHDASGLVLQLEEGRTFSALLVFERDESGRPVSIAGDRDKIERLIPKLARQLGKDADDFEFELQEPPSSQIAYHRVSVYTPTLARAVLKSAVQVVAYYLRESYPSIVDILRPFR